MNKKRLGTTVAVVTTAAAVLLTGTYAWQSANQEAKNLASGIVNPGGRLHEDFDGENKKIYVENFGNQNIYARIMLKEYFEIGVSAGQNFESEDRNVTKITGEDSDYNDRLTWPVHYYDVDNLTEQYLNIDYGTGTVKYMPTFNLNKDSLEADINGTYFYDDGLEETTDDRYKDFVDYSLAENETKTADEIFDADTDTIDQYKDGSGVENVNYSINANQTHTVATSLEACVKSMSDWNSMTEDEQNATACWIYDSDGWAYWSKAIEPKTATGSLLGKISIKNVEDNWFHAITSIAQFITADDLGIKDNTGFYDDTKGTAPSDDALELLKTIGVDTTKAITLYTPNDLKTLAVDSGDGVYLDTTEEGRYVYKGAAPNNYITFNDEFAGWRIISIEPDNTIKIMRNTSVGQFERDSNNSNQWANASLNTYLNETYYATLTDTQYIQNKDFNVGAVNLDGNSLEDQIAEEKSLTWNGNIGIMTTSDYILSNSNTEECGTLYLNNSNSETCLTTTWIQDVIKTTDFGYMWTINPKADDESHIGINVADYGPLTRNMVKDDGNGASPVLYLKSNITLIGEGNSESPYEIQ